MWIHRFTLNLNPQHVGTKVVVRTIFLLPRIYCSLYNRVYMVVWVRCLKCRGSGRVMTREIQVTRGSGHNDPRVVFGRPAGRPRGSGPQIRIFANVQLPDEGPPPEGHARDPWVLPVGPELYNTCRVLPEGLSRGDTPNTERISERIEQLYQALVGEPRVG